MSKNTGKIWRVLTLLIIGAYINYEMVKNADEESFLYMFTQGGCVLLFAGMFIWSFVRDGKEYKQTRSGKSFIPTFTGIVLFISFITTDYLLKARDSSPLLIQAGYDGGFNGAWFEFREDGTYKFANSGGVGASYFRGTYTIQDSLIELDKSAIDRVIKTSHLLIRSTEMNSSNDKIIYQINDTHEVIDKSCEFRINLDNRKK